MATSGLTCVVRHSFSKFIQPRRSNLLIKKSQKLAHINDVFCPCASFGTTVSYNSNVSVQYRHGLSVFTVPLPSRKESCEFTLKPVSNTVKDFVNFLKDEDKGIDRIAVYKDDGTRVAGSTTIDILLRSNFKLAINENSYSVAPPEQDVTVPSEDFQRFSEVKSLTAKLYSQLNVEEFQLRREQVIIRQLEEYKVQIQPYLTKKSEMEEKILFRNTSLMYVGSGLMGVQFGFFSRLTWWEYSWDVMEPVTYFATYAAVIGMFAYFAVASQEYNYGDVWNREFVRKFYAMAKKNGFDIEEHNRLAALIAECESDLRRLRDPLQVHLPIREL